MSSTSSGLVQSSRKWLQRSSSDESSASDDVGSSHSGEGSGKPSKLQVTKPTVGRSPSPYKISDGKSGGPVPNNRAPATGSKLAQEIHDEFLVCKICLEGYKNPKCLDCLHTFCEQCIDNHVNSEPSYKKYSDYREFTCPLCRKRTQLPVGGVRKLPDNFLVSSLIEVVGRQRPSKYPVCDFCKTVSRKQREATSKCLDCAKLLCANCVHLHRNTKVTSAHSLFDVEIEKEIECKDHSEEVVRFYCEPCDSCICVLCTFNQHRDHEISHFNEAVVKYRASIQTLLDACKRKTDQVDDQVHVLDQVEDVIKVVEQKIHDTAVQFIQEIRTQEKQLIEELQNIYGSDCTACIQSKKELIQQSENLRNTCSLTEVILMGKDMELLLLKRDVEEKLTALNALEFRDLPKTVSKVVDFVSGCVDFGSIDDRDGPPSSPSKTRPGGGGGEKEGGAGKSYTDSWVQTDRQATTMAADRATMTEDSGGSIASVFHSLRGGGGGGGGGTVASAPSPAHGPPPPAPGPGDESADDDGTLAARRRRRRERDKVGGPGGCWAGGSSSGTNTAAPRHPSAPSSDRAPPTGSSTGGGGGSKQVVAEADEGGSAAAATRRN